MAGFGLVQDPGFRVTLMWQFRLQKFEILGVIHEYDAGVNYHQGFTVP